MIQEPPPLAGIQERPGEPYKTYQSTSKHTSICISCWLLVPEVPGSGFGTFGGDKLGNWKQLQGGRLPFHGISWIRLVV